MGRRLPHLAIRLVVGGLLVGAALVVALRPAPRSGEPTDSAAEAIYAEVLRLEHQARLVEARIQVERLLADHPDFPLLEKAVIALAERFGEAVSRADADVGSIDRQLNGGWKGDPAGALERVRRALNDESALVGHIADLNNQAAQQERLAPGRVAATRTAIQRGMEGLDGLRRERAALEADCAALLEKRRVAVAARVTAAEPQADLYWRWDQVVKAADARSDDRPTGSAAGRTSSGTPDPK